MFLTTQTKRIFVAEHIVDFRRAHDGLLAEAFRLKLDPFKGDVVIFVGRRRNRIKVLHADTTGLWISWKQFTVETMKTRFQFLSEPSCRTITQGELGMLLEGSSYKLLKQVTPYSPKENLTANQEFVQDP
jgi:transposase